MVVLEIFFKRNIINIKEKIREEEK